MLRRLDSIEDALSVARRMRDADRREVHACRWNNDDDGLAYDVVMYDTHMKWVADWNGTPTALIGAVNIWPHVWSVFMVATDDFHHIGFPLTRFVKRDMIPGIKMLGAKRAEARSMASHVTAHRWLKALGATQEATLRNFGKNGEDFVVFAWTA